MSVAVTGFPEYLIFAGQVDHRYPLGRWWANISLAGDVTGGTAQIVIELVPAALPPSGMSFSLDAISPQTTLNSASTAVLHINGFAPTRLASSSVDLAYLMELGVGAGTATLERSSNLRLPLHMGQRRDGIAGNFDCVFSGNGDAETFTLVAVGFLWLPQALELVGGPQMMDSPVPLASPDLSMKGTYREIQSGKISPELQQELVDFAAAKGPRGVWGTAAPKEVLAAGWPSGQTQGQAKPVVLAPAGPSVAPLLRSQGASTQVVVGGHRFGSQSQADRAATLTTQRQTAAQIRSRAATIRGARERIDRLDLDAMKGGLVPSSVLRYGSRRITLADERARLRRGLAKLLAS